MGKIKYRMLMTLMNMIYTYEICVDPPNLCHLCSINLLMINLIFGLMCPDFLFLSIHFLLNFPLRQFVIKILMACALFVP